MSHLPTHNEIQDARAFVTAYAIGTVRLTLHDALDRLETEHECAAGPSTKDKLMALHDDTMCRLRNWVEVKTATT